MGTDRTENGVAAYEELFSLRLPIDGYIVNMDTTDIRAQTAEIQKIGANVNQIAKRLNSMGPVYAKDIEDIKGGAGADMAVTKIHPIKSTLKKALDYIRGGWVLAGWIAYMRLNPKVVNW